MSISLTDQAAELAYDCIKARGLFKELSNSDADALADRFAPLIQAYALDLVDKELARRDEAKQRQEAA